jgi:phosphohistidine phosphatase
MTAKNLKRLTLLRHAKSSWDNPGLGDFERPLNKRGQRDAPLMGRYLADQGILFDLLMVSPATRARMTAEVIAEQLEIDRERLTFNGQIYQATVNELVALLRTIADDQQNVLLVGHNPGITDLANFLVDGQLENIPTCGLFSVELPIQSWQQLDRASARLLFYDYPKKIAKT